MKICILRHSKFPPDATVMKELNCLVDAGHQVDIICLRHPGQPALEVYRSSARFIRIPIQHKRGGLFRYMLEYGLSFCLMTLLVTWLHLRRRYDCVQINTMPDFLVFAAVVPKMMGTPVLLHLHEPTPELWMTKFGFGVNHPLFRFQALLEQWAIRYSDRALTVTETLRTRYGERGADLGKIVVLPNVCDEQVERRMPRRPPLRDAGFRLLTHGLIEERYGHELVLRAVKQLAGEIPGLRYDIPGEGEYQPAVESLVRRLDLGDRVRFHGWMDFDDLIQLLHDCDAGVIPMRQSPYSELIDTCKMYEFMAIGKPVIVSRLRTVEENFDDSCVMFFEPGNSDDLARCILELRRNARRREELVSNAYRRYQKMRWSVTKNTYRRIVEGMAVRPPQFKAAL